MRVGARGVRQCVSTMNDKCYTGGCPCAVWGSRVGQGWIHVLGVRARIIVHPCLSASTPSSAVLVLVGKRKDRTLGS